MGVVMSLHVPPSVCYCSFFLASRLISSARLSLAIVLSPTLTRSPCPPLSLLACIDNGAMYRITKLTSRFWFCHDAMEGKKLVHDITLAMERFCFLACSVLMHDGVDGWMDLDLA